ncbi:hypothetical protein SC738_14965 [Legionella pneumophila serogroup 1]|nr:hypothetical protein [Legionella pneumophila]HAT8823253.1 hypothetical protein [Legionella pneumophila subsp. pneumophila]MCZ4737530.1 hypothetical protein [Legionella pneumophila]MCZ4747037.1 hypothetical protein [Legionella pneumophila]MDI9829408.1 hypothetical protein [Legionella pneumophila]MDO5160143.1 hypothetical protein [Legionella pneumophila]
MKKLSFIFVTLLMLWGSSLYAAQYKVTVKKVGDNMYQDLNTGALIKTSLCLELALGEDAILKWDCTLGSEMYGCGKLVFIDFGRSCQVDAVH